MSRLKEVLERRLFRDNGMLGPENPQGILNSSPELSDVVRMQNGGFYLGQSPVSLDGLQQSDATDVPVFGAETLQSDAADVPVFGAETLQIEIPLAPPPEALSTDEAQEAIEEAPTSEAVLDMAEIQAPNVVSSIVTDVSVGRWSRELDQMVSTQQADILENGTREEKAAVRAQVLKETESNPNLSAHEIIAKNKDTTSKPYQANITLNEKTRDETFAKGLSGKGGEVAAPPPVDNVVLSELIGRRGEAADAYKINTLVNAALRAEKIREGHGTTGDLKDIKDELAAVMPALEEDGVSEGLMAMFLGLSIAEKGVAAGGKEALPGLINFYAQRRSEKIKRDQAISSAAITEHFSRKKEDRALEAALLEKQVDTEFDVKEYLYRKQVDEEFDTDMYTIAGDKVIQFETAEGKPRQLKLFAGQHIPVNNEEALALGDLGVKLVKMGTYKPTIGTDYSAESFANLASRDPTTFNKYFDSSKNIKIPVPMGDPLEISVSKAKPSLQMSKWAANGVPVHDLITDAAAQGLQTRYEGRRGSAVKLIEDIDGLSDMLKDPETYKTFTSLGRAQESVGSFFKGLGGPFAEQSEALGRALLGGKDIGSQNLFEAKARLILAQIAPIILGESGRTISNEDRQRVAQALGFNIEQDDSGKWTIIGGISEKFLKNPTEIKHALLETRNVLAKMVQAGDQGYMGFLESVGRLNLEQAGPQYKEAPGFNIPSEFLESDEWGIKKGKLVSGAQAGQILDLTDPDFFTFKPGL